MYRILKVQHLSEKNWLMEIQAPYITRRCQPGQFLIVRTGEMGERIPLTICDYDREKETVTIVFQVVGVSTARLSELREGECLTDIVGPLGRPSDFVNEDPEQLQKMHYLFVCGGVGIAPVYPQVKWLSQHGVKCDVIMAARSKDLIFYEEQMRSVAENVFITTDDGSYGMKGVGTDMVRKLVSEEGRHYDRCVAIGPVVMMKFTSLCTKELGIPTIVSMNPIMIDGTGMCGACRIVVDGKVKFACVDGPEFDGHLVDYDLAMKRARQYKEEETAAMHEYQEHHCSCSGRKEAA
ncbi:MAG: sulfide/dihydroorotate dehydrogenase-like FAD/NAD-binding protein [Erysipelotrichaceae bacterium]|nr:sulfide/dihydroorotate dehydrogenase-like FAD/NAD-binding protein [Erysipelotrichaceae bacterium]